MSSAWEDAAAELGLTIAERTAVLQRPKLLEGALEGCSVKVKYTDSDGDTSTSYRVGNRQSYHPLVQVRGRVIERTWSRSFLTGDPEWDRRFVVKAQDENRAILFLTNERRAAFDVALRRLPPNWEFRRGVFEAGRDERASRNDIVETVRTLVQLANVLAFGPTS